MPQMLLREESVKIPLRLLVILPCAILLAAIPVRADPMEKARQECNGDDADGAIRGCSMLLGMTLQEGPLSDAQKSVAIKAFVLRGGAYEAKGQTEQAVLDYGEAIHLDPDHFDAHIQRGFLLLDSGRIDGAFADFDRATQLDSGSFHAFGFRGLAHAALGRDEEAIADYDRAFQLGGDPMVVKMLEAAREEAVKRLAAQE